MIRNLVFDLGGVVFRWRPVELIERVFPDLRRRELLRDGFLKHEDWLELDRGRIRPEEAVRRVAERTGLAPQEVRSFLDRVPASLRPVPGTVKLLQKLAAAGYRLDCLSNMHAESWEYLQDWHPFLGLFQRRIISCYLGTIKPELSIYEHLLSDPELRPEESVFLDDLEVNLAPARELGLHTVLFRNPEQAATELKNLGVRWPQE